MSAFFEQPNAPVNGQHIPNPRPLPRSNSIPSWHKNASMVSLQSPPQPSVASAPSLRKRHSTYVLPTSPDPATTPVPVPGTSPIRPLRNPARVATPTSPPLSKKKSGSKSPPSTATGTREEITPWEFQPGPVNNELSQASPVASDSNSPLLNRSRQSLATGPVSEVTPWEMYPVRRSATGRSSFTSGFVEEVTPWELHPVPIVMPNRSTLATGFLEDVTPWELSPAPPSTESSATISEKRSPTRGSTSSNQDKSPSDVTQLRRRKSTSAKATKPRFTFFGTSFHPGHPSASKYPFSEGVQSSAKSAPKTTSSRPPLPPLALLSTSNERDTPTTTPQQNLNFSAADRTIFEELKRNLEARDAHFVIKGEGSSRGSSLTRRGKKHHAFAPERVPYPRSYDREVIDLDVWETASCRDMCKSLTWHVFQSPPTKVLDLGCGTGTWVLNCARAWKNCHLVGLDIVPLQPDLHRVGSSDLASRITWVHTNFLESLPFPDGEFDFVHIKRIALGVPEDKWDGLFQEILRVMKPGGAFEMIEEDLFFPGKLVDSNGDSEPDIDLENSSSVVSSHHDSTQSYWDTNLESLADSGPPSFRSNGHSPPTSTAATFLATPSRSNSPVADVLINEDMEKEAREILFHAIGDGYILPPEGSSPHGQVLNETLSPATIGGHLQIKTSQSAFVGSVVSLNPSSVGSRAALDGEKNLEPKGRTRSRAHSLSTFLPIPTANSQRPSPIPETKSTTLSEPLLVRTIPKPPSNPRDHTLLKTIYTRLLESKFINISPLPLLAKYVGSYFKDLRTHPPLQYHFPASLHSNHSSNSDREDSESERLSSDDTDDARDAILPSPVSRTIRKKHSRRVPAQNGKGEHVSISEENHYGGVWGFIHHSAPYITLDESRASALSPSIRGLFPDISSARFQLSFLPNTTMHLDLKTLNLHLALRAAEIIACSEAMWEWVQKFQAEVKARRDREAESRRFSRSHRSGSGSIEMPAQRSTVSVATSSSDPFERSILDLTREEFDGLISKFEMDMRDNCDVKNALGARFSWHASEPTVSQERQDFEQAYEKWVKWEQEQAAATPSHVGSHHQHPYPPSGAHVTTLHHPSAAENSRVQGRPVPREQQKKRISTSSISSLPTRRLSRVIRVFVAWKPFDIPLEDPS